MKRLMLVILTTSSLSGLGMSATASSPSSSIRAEPPTLSANPFTRPRNLTSGRRSQPADPGSSASGGRELRAVLAGNRGGIANLGGELVETGKIFGGYQLMRIERDTAIFKRDGKEIRLEIGEDLPDE